MKELLIEDRLDKLIFIAKYITDTSPKNTQNVYDMLCSDIIAYLYFLANCDNNISSSEILTINQIITKINNTFLFDNNIKTLSQLKDYLKQHCPNAEDTDYIYNIPSSFLIISELEKRNLLPMQSMSYSEIYYEVLILIGEKVLFSDHNYSLIELKSWLEFLSTINIYKRDAEMNEVESIITQKIN